MRKLIWAMLLVGAAAHADPTDDWRAVADGELEQVRAGFELPGGVLVALGVERLVSINGTVVANTHFSIPDMTQLSAADVQMASDALAGVLMQNSLNDQTLRSQTTINATVANLSMLKAVNFESSLRDALNGAVGK